MAASALRKVSTHTIAGESFKASAWTAGHLQHTIEVLAAKHPGTQLVIKQPCFNTGVDASKHTHDFDGVLDVKIEGLTWAKAQSFLRSQGWAAWHRTPAQGFKHHIHMATIPPGLSGHPKAAAVGAAYQKLGIKVGKFIDGGFTTTGKAFTSSQIVDYFNHAFGLANHHAPNSDTSWFPPDISRTIYQAEDDMTKEELIQVLNSKAGQEAIAKAVIQNRLGGQDDKPRGGRTVEHSISKIYNMLLEINARLDKLEA